MSLRLLPYFTYTCRECSRALTELHQIVEQVLEANSRDTFSLLLRLDSSFARVNVFQHNLKVFHQPVVRNCNVFDDARCELLVRLFEYRNTVQSCSPFSIE